MTPTPSHISDTVTVIGGGLAGTEAALQLSSRGCQVRLFEMRPGTPSPAHHTDRLAELVCSNSLKSTDDSTAAGQLKRELTALGSRVLATAHETSVPAGGALAVDRGEFSARLTDMVESDPHIELRRREVTELPEGPVIVATGPLTSTGFEDVLSRLVGPARLAFFDAAAPIVDAGSIDRTIAFPASRYGKGEGDDYLNCPMNRDEYERFVAALIDARRVHAKDFERRELFSACQPAEEIARSGMDALRYGPLKPVGLIDPRTGERPWAVVQLRAENRANTAYNLVGFQTNLAFPEQDRVFRMIPGLETAEFLRYGVMHRNTFVDAPHLLDATLAVRSCPRVRIAGQLAGTEGYLEAAASGLLAALGTLTDMRGLEPLMLPPTGAFGALIAYATDPATERYQPMHVNWGLVPPLEIRLRGKRERYAAYADRAQKDTLAALANHPLTPGAGVRP
ncbi:MAG: methylenetetrahydrofolate--tRNA-(uracil(54)-C(5))-methyltransferase (FADH(2)-oxidizing) TrmFO [Actinobacteria bacterium HGW-Actinobacteria-9]|nr:MAG: methylenetetrahydrofolate--tRNA-(uracil(54)-C(5))-methyltransferase (FADH(2)-oxidizing) TrmFO [Actinobacteria bacterium HGW-Actinobacteria-9]